MAFSLYALLGNEAPSFSNESLAVDLKNYFRQEEGFSIEFEQLPFAHTKTLVLHWNMWLVRVCYEEGENVVADSIEIQKLLGATATPALSTISKRIRIVFGDDERREHTNQIIYIIDFLKEIHDLKIFDPQQNNLVNSV